MGYEVPMAKATQRISAAKSPHERARQIARAYASTKDAAKSAPKEIGKRKTKRIPIPPFRRPDAVFKQAVYELACEFHFRGPLPLKQLVDHVRARDEPFRHRPRNATVVDWVIRLVDRAPRELKSALGAKNIEPLLEPTFASHLATELNFALRHEIHARYVAMFIDYVGGYEIISAMEKAENYDLSDEPWLARLYDPRLEHANQREVISQVEAEDEALRQTSRTKAETRLVIERVRKKIPRKSPSHH